MNDIPRITVIMGIYNCANTLIEALESLEAQTYQRFQVVLCDDGSNDNTLEVAIKWAETRPNYKVIGNERNMGLNFTLNHCLQYADTEFIARMDGDDLSKPTRFEKEIKFLDEHPEYAVVSTPMDYFDENGVFMTGRGRGEIKKENFLTGTPICHAPCMARTEVIKSVGGYSVDEKLLRVEDYHLWFKVFAAGHKIYVMNEVLYQMRDDRNAIIRRNWAGYLNIHYVMRTGFKMIGLPWYCQVYSLRPLIIGALPKWLYKKLHKR